MDKENGQLFENSVLADLSKIIENEDVSEGPSYWITLPNENVAFIKTIISNNKFYLLAFGARDSHHDHGFAGALEFNLSAPDNEVIEASGYIETTIKGFGYAVALEISRQDILQRLANQSGFTILQRITDANQSRLDSNTREAWEKLYGKDGYFGFDNSGVKKFPPQEMGISFDNLGAVKIKVEKNTNPETKKQQIIIGESIERSTKENPRSNRDELKTEIQSLLKNHPIEDPF